MNIERRIINLSDKTIDFMSCWVAGATAQTENGCAMDRLMILVIRTIAVIRIIEYCFVLSLKMKGIHCNSKVEQGNCMGSSIRPEDRQRKEHAANHFCNQSTKGESPGYECIFKIMSL